MADLLGENPNLCDDLFADSEAWVAILSSMADFGVDQKLDECEPPAPLVD